MANHTGFIFISSTGLYLHRSKNNRMALNVHLDMATLFPNKEWDTIVPGDLHNWIDVQNAIKLDSIIDILDYLTPLPARSLQRIEIGEFSNEL